MSIPTVATSSQGLSAPKGSARTMAGITLIYLPAILLAGSAMAKFAHAPGVVHQMAAIGFAGPKLMLIASLEILSALLFAWPGTRPLGILMVSAYLGGAICAHAAVSDYPHTIPASVVLALAWTGMWMRYPEIFSITTVPPPANAN